MEISTEKESLPRESLPPRSLSAFQERIVDILEPLMITYGNIGGGAVRQSVHSAFDSILHLHEAISREEFLKGPELDRSAIIVAAFVDAVQAHPVDVLWQSLPDAIPTVPDAYPTIESAVAAHSRSAAHMLTGGLLDASYAAEITVCIRQFQQELWGRLGLSRHIPLIRGRASFDDALGKVAKSFRAACGWRVASRIARVVNAEPSRLLPVAYAIGDIHYCRLLAELSGSANADRWRLAAEATPYGLPLGIVHVEGSQFFVIAHFST